MRRITILLATVGALLLVPAAQASALGWMTVNIGGNGAGEVSSVGGYAGSGILEGEPPIECTYASPGFPEGECETELVEFSGIEGIALHAVAAPGSEFIKWKFEEGLPFSGQCGENPECIGYTSTPGGEVAVKAIFNTVGTPRSYELTTEVGGPESAGAELLCDTGGGPGACAEEYLEGTKVEISAVPGPGAALGAWEKDCSGTGLGQDCVLTMSANHVAKGWFDSPRSLTIKTSGTGGGTVACDTGGGPEACLSQYGGTANVELIPTAAGGSEFTGWSGSCTGTGTCSFSMGEPRSVTVNFEATATPNLKLNVEEGEGTVVSNPAGLTCSKAAPGSCEAAVAEGPVVLTASPAPGYAFKGWKGCDTGGAIGRQCTVTATSSLKSVGVKFYKVWNLAMSKSNPNGIASTSPGGVNCGYGCLASAADYKPGSVTLKAKPAKNFHFVEFKGGTGSASSCNGVSTETCSITIGEDSSIEEVYAENAKNTLTLTKTGGGQAFIKTKPTNINCGYTCGAATAEFFAAETAVPVTVALNKGTTSVTWSGGSGGTTCTSNQLTCTVDMSSNQTLTAEFK